MGEFHEVGQKAHAAKPVNRMARLLVGFVIGSACPISYGIWWMFHEIAYSASLPKGPNIASCGMGRLGAMLTIFIVGPICGVVGAGVSALYLEIQNRINNRRDESSQ